MEPPLFAASLPISDTITGLVKPTTARSRAVPFPAPAEQESETPERISSLPERPRRGRNWTVLVAILAGAAGLIYELNHRAKQATPGPAVRTVRVRPGILERTLRLTGTIAPENGVMLRAPYLRGRRTRGGGRGDFTLVLKELASRGTQVKKGDVVAVFDRQYMIERLDNYKATRDTAEAIAKAVAAQVNVKQTAHHQLIRTGKGTMDKAGQDLRTVEVRAANKADLFRLAFEEAQMRYNAMVNDAGYVAISGTSQIRVAQIDVEEADIEVRRAETSMERMVARAPRDGLVVIQDTVLGGDRRAIVEGDELRPGQIYIQIIDPSSLMIEARANQVDVKNLHIGTRAHVHSDAHSDIALQARVYSVGTVAKGRGWRRGFVNEVPVFLTLDSTDSRLIPGSSVAADVVLAREESANLVAREAVFTDMQDGHPFALVQGANGWEKRALKLGLANSTHVAVLSGLNEGETVAIEMPPEFNN